MADIKAEDFLKIHQQKDIREIDKSQSTEGGSNKKNKKTPPTETSS